MRRACTRVYWASRIQKSYHTFIIPYWWSCLGFSLDGRDQTEYFIFSIIKIYHSHKIFISWNSNTYESIVFAKSIQGKILKRVYKDSIIMHKGMQHKKESFYRDYAFTFRFKKWMNSQWQIELRIDEKLMQAASHLFFN